MKQIILALLGAAPLAAYADRWLFRRLPAASAAVARSPLAAAPAPAAGTAPASLLLHHLRGDDVLFAPALADREQLFAYIGQHLAASSGWPAEAVTQGLLRRERVGSSALGKGMAIPCARIEAAAAPRALYVRLQPAIDFAAPDGRHVSDAIVLLVPKPATEAHLHLLANATQVFADPGLRRRLRACADADALIRTLREWQPAS